MKKSKIRPENQFHQLVDSDPPPGGGLSRNMPHLGSEQLFSRYTEHLFPAS